MILNKRHQVIALKGVIQGAQFMQHTAQGPNVAFEGIRLILTYFRTHVVRSAHHCLCLLQSGFQDFADAKVPDFDSSIGG